MNVERNQKLKKRRNFVIQFVEELDRYEENAAVPTRVSDVFYIDIYYQPKKSIYRECISKNHQKTRSLHAKCLRKNITLCNSCVK